MTKTFAGHSVYQISKVANQQT